MKEIIGYNCLQKQETGPSDSGHPCCSSISQVLKAEETVRPSGLNFHMTQAIHLTQLLFAEPRNLSDKKSFCLNMKTVRLTSFPEVCRSLNVPTIKMDIFSWFGLNLFTSIYDSYETFHREIKKLPSIGNDPAFAEITISLFCE